MIVHKTYKHYPMVIMMTTYGDTVGDTNPNQTINTFPQFKELSKTFLMCDVANVGIILQKGYVFMF